MKQVVEACKDLVSEASFQVSPEKGIEMMSMSTNQVSFVAIHMGVKSHFEYFQCDQPCEFGVSLETLSTILKTASAGDTLEMTYRFKQAPDVLVLKFENPASPHRVSTYEIKLLNLEVEQHVMPDDVKFDAVFSLRSTDLQHVCRDMALMGGNVDSIKICCGGSDKMIRFVASGDRGTGMTQLEAASVLSWSSPVDLVFSLRILTAFCKATPLSPTVTLSMSNSNNPLVVDYGGIVTFYLAPKITDDE